MNKFFLLKYCISVMSLFPLTTIFASQSPSYSIYDSQMIAHKDLDDEDSLYDRNARSSPSHWDYRQNWRYRKEAFLRGDNRPEDEIGKNHHSSHPIQEEARN